MELLEVINQEMRPSSDFKDYYLDSWKNEVEYLRIGWSFAGELNFGSCCPSQNNIPFQMDMAKIIQKTYNVEFHSFEKYSKL